LLLYLWWMSACFQSSWHGSMINSSTHILQFVSVSVSVCLSCGLWFLTLEWNRVHCLTNAPKEGWGLLELV
jgi:hypothetical protein